MATIKAAATHLPDNPMSCRRRVRAAAKGLRMTSEKPPRMEVCIAGMKIPITISAQLIRKSARMNHQNSARPVRPPNWEYFS